MASHMLEGSWYNQRGSVLTLSVGEGGKLGGTFDTGVGFQSPGEMFEVTGFARGDLVAFVVGFGEHHSLTSWVGHVVDNDGERQLDTLWQMTVEFPPPKKPDERWKGSWCGSDLFTRKPSANKAMQARFPPHPMRH